MPKCDLCAKKPIRATSRSHSNIKTLRRQKPNLQKFLGLKMCGSCRRTVQKEIAKDTA